VHCPRCPDQPLQEHVIEDWKPLVCTRCGGLWIDPDSFRDAVMRPPPPGLDQRETAGARPAIWEESPLACPACNVPMKKGNYAYSSGVIIDRCPSCRGIWLDRGELAKLRAFVNRKVPQDKVLMAQLETATLRKRLEAQERRDNLHGMLGVGGSHIWWVGWKELISLLREVL
jgi:Zn-finger nucleic acid-binding protein